MAKILIVDDEPSVRFALTEVLADHEVVEADRAAAALARAGEVALVITDLAMPGGDGMELLENLQRDHPSLPVIMLTAHGDERTAVRALRAGAYDYLVKPFDVDEVLAAVRRGLETHRLRGARDRAEAERRLGVPLVGESPTWRRLVDRALRIAPRDVTVVVRGETGTGKELVASLIHAASGRSSGPLVRFNCAAVPAELAEAELFGHRRGAFTGAATSSSGYFGAADGGTLVLDEVGALPAAVQPKLLRALQDGEIQPVGEAKPRRVDIRVVASTLRDLEEAVRTGHFREDLYYRLAVVQLVVPPLRERPEDIPLLAEALRRRHAAQMGLDDIPFDGALHRSLAAYDWPGNVRELENAVVALLAFSVRGEVNPDDFRPGGALPPAAAEAGGLAARMWAYERRLLVAALRDAEGNRSEAARRLEISRTTLLDKLSRHGLR
ncbi:MAG: sigma-54 dependent transcriptional regulator [Myxococcota bacterium]